MKGKKRPQRKNSRQRALVVIKKEGGQSMPEEKETGIELKDGGVMTPGTLDELTDGKGEDDEQ